MKNYLKYRTDFKKLINEKQKVISSNAEKVKKAKAENRPGYEIHQLREAIMYDELAVDEEIAILITSYLTSQAQLRFIPIPGRDNDEMWTECHLISEQIVLTDAGIYSLRNLLKKELKEKFELYSMALSLLIGLFGVAIGLISVIK
jgi:hypothetical protein